MRSFRNTVFVLIVAASVLSSVAKAASNRFDVEITPVDLSEEDSDRLTDTVMQRTDVQARLKDHRYRLLGTHFSPAFAAHGVPEKDEATDDGYAVQLYDYTSDRVLTVVGNGTDFARDKILETREQPTPSYDEFMDAVELLNKDAIFGAGLAMGLWSPYPAMPPTISPKYIAGGANERIIPVGLRSLDPSARHEIVGVNLSRLTVHRFPEGAPPTAIAAPVTCGPPSAGQATTRRGTAGTAEVTVRRGGEEIWRMTVIRPSASSGALGSGIDLKNVTYKGRAVLARAHVPILNVNYDANRCGPYRDWAYAENAFKAEGTALASGILRASSRPSTIADSLNDSGNFRGVAVYESGPELILVTEISAGWYRYAIEYRFHEDGTIRPRFYFTAVHNSCVCNTHHHHAYWRFDFDVGGARANSADYLAGDGWRAITKEAKFLRDSSHRAWRIVNRTNGEGYRIDPGPDDSTANAYGRGDVWILKYNSGQVDDSRVRRSTQANLDAFVSGENIEQKDLVFWYAGHFRHTSDGDHEEVHVVGPTLRPISAEPSASPR